MSQSALLYQIPVSLHKMVSDRIMNIVNGKDPDMITGLQIFLLSVHLIHSLCLIDVCAAVVAEIPCYEWRLTLPSCYLSFSNLSLLQERHTAQDWALKPIQKMHKKPPKKNFGPYCGQSMRTLNSRPKKRDGCWDSFIKATQRFLFSTLAIDCPVSTCCSSDIY